MNSDRSRRPLLCRLGFHRWRLATHRVGLIACERCGKGLAQAK